MSATQSHLRPADDLLGPAVAETLSALQLEPSDAALRRLLELYAGEIDAAADPEVMLDKLGPKVLAALTALRATPASRAPREATHGRSALDELRARRSG